MSPNSNEEASGDPQPEKTLGQKAGAGFAWLAGQAGVTKLVGIASQLVLAAILFPEDFGQVALVMSFVAFASIVQTGGVKQVLIHHQATFDSWASSAFWLSLLQGVAAGLLLLLAAPIAVSLYGDTALLPLLFVAAAAPPFAALSIVPEARLQIDARYRFLAMAEIVVAVLQAGIAIGLASLGFGALSIIAALPVVAVIRAGILWIAAPPSIHSPEFWRWRHLFSQSAFVLVATLAFAVTAQAAVVSLGLFSTVTEVGLYYFAYNLSIQAVALFTSRLQIVLLPTLSSIEANPLRQMTVTQRATSALALITFPIYALLVVVARPLIDLLYAEKWEEAISIFVVLAVAMIARSVTPPAGILLLAQGRFRTYMWVHIGSATFFVLLVVPATAAYGAMGAAGAVVIHAYVAFAATWLIVAGRQLLGLTALTRHLALILGAAAIAAGAGALAQSLFISDGARGDVVRIAVAGTIAVGTYIGIVRRFASDVVGDVTVQIMSVAKRGR